MRTLLLAVSSVLFALPVARSAWRGAGDEPWAPYVLKKLAAEPLPEEGGEAVPPALPEEVPAAFRELLEPAGLRVEDAGGKVLYDLWLVKEIPLAAEKRKGELGTRFGNLPIGTLVGVLRSYGHEYDYKEIPIAEGCYALRYGVQPEDGDHLGTSPTRDFLVLTSFRHDKKVLPVEDMERLNNLAKLASSTEHPLTLYLIEPQGEESKEARLYPEGERDEWIVEVAPAARVAGVEEATKLRLGIVMIGCSKSL
ncbi:MAG: hypothetical protein HY812_00345 [Planctomycetes bacterium]|nr:hypothetical protein [Planctomycetota bacterium]